MARAIAIFLFTFLSIFKVQQRYFCHKNCKFATIFGELVLTHDVILGYMSSAQYYVCYSAFLFCDLQPKATGEQKTKPTQNSVRELRALGLSPDLVCFTWQEMTMSRYNSLPKNCVRTLLIYMQHLVSSCQVYVIYSVQTRRNSKQVLLCFGLNNAHQHTQTSVLNFARNVSPWKT